MQEIPQSVDSIIKTIESGGFEAFIVGGCVRDMLIGITPSDYDITTNALPTQIKSIFKKTVDTGIKHGTVTVMIDKNPLEITTMRRDGKYTDNRHPDSVEFTSAITEDLSRRDFTVNAIAYSEKSGICDPFGGYDDIKNQVIRCVGNADARFGEDALRIFRAVRFSSVLGFGIEEKTAQSVLKNREKLKNVSAERIRSELLKTLCGKDVLCKTVPSISIKRQYKNRTTL